MEIIGKESAHILPVNVDDMRVRKKVLIKKLPDSVDIPDPEISIGQDASSSSSCIVVQVNPASSQESVSKTSVETVPKSLAARSIAQNIPAISTSTKRSALTKRPASSSSKIFSHNEYGTLKKAKIKQKLDMLNKKAEYRAERHLMEKIGL
ncbi:uncharacterized protein LOC124815235 [Hydra vulgaris]|uniref:uncharacterized protein LOC124815235 n=1 Tax=Hydra vulgaris TaxID=6087 RepID=UPI001F5EDEFF|nr:uncharacterized protein LOC124815235 [Hydra vulgaris]